MAQSTAGVMRVPFFKASISRDELEACDRVLKSGWLTTGSETHKFEEEFARKTGSAHALAVNSNTSGMILAMEALGVREGANVITTPYTFVSTASSARHLGADVFFADIEKATYSIDPGKIEDILKSPKGSTVRAIVCVHIGGALCNMKDILALARKYNVSVIEDCAHAFPSRTTQVFGVSAPPVYAGTIGDAGVFSFYATKTITCGEGGMVTTSNDDAAKRIAQMRLHGMNRDAWDRYTAKDASWEYDVTSLGYKFNLPDILSAIGRAQLKKCDVFLEKRLAIAKRYDEAFRELDFIKLPPTSEGNTKHLYLLRLDLAKLAEDCTRDTFARELQARGVGVSVHFIPLYRFTYWKSLYPEFTKERFPETEQKALESISIPMWPDMTDGMVSYVIKSVREIGEKYYAKKH